MFICQNCREQQPPGISPHQVITEIRDRIYPYREHANHDSPDLGGKGWEIVEELSVCEGCNTIMTAED